MNNNEVECFINLRSVYGKANDFSRRKGTLKSHLLRIKNSKYYKELTVEDSTLCQNCLGALSSLVSSKRWDDFELNLTKLHAEIVLFRDQLTQPQKSQPE